MLWLLAAGIAGSRDPLSNPLPLTVWTLLWIGLTLLQGLFGNLWHWINPWYAAGAARPAVLGCRGRTRSETPDVAGRIWPAPVLFAAFAWFELIDLAPDDPQRLARGVAAYWLFTFAAMLSSATTHGAEGASSCPSSSA